MLLPGTEMHIVTFVFVTLETIMFFFQVVFYLFRPEDKGRLWYLTLLTLLLNYNIASGLLPDPNIPVPVYIQNIIAYGSGFIMASFFPFYFYKAFGLRRLKFHAVYGIYLFLLFPYLLFFVIIYSINEDLHWARQYGLIIPFFYSISLLWAITRAVIEKYRENNMKDIKEIIGVYLAVAPWVSLTVVVYLDAGQPIEASVTNGGFLVITILYIRTTIRQYRMEYRELQSLNLIMSEKIEERTRYLEQKAEEEKIAIVDTFRKFREFQIKESQQTLERRIEEAGRSYELTRREREIVLLIAKGKRNSEIAETLFIAERTVSKHIENIFKKVNVNSKVELLKKLVLPSMT